jgi:predicted ribosomally synthesized peptide with SipW-like signal peptide
MKTERHKIFTSIRKIAAVLAVLLLAVLARKIEGTNSYFSDTEVSSENSFTARTWSVNTLGIQSENILAPNQEAVAEEPAPELIETPPIDDVTNPVVSIPPLEEEASLENPLPEETVIVPEEAATSEDINTEESTVTPEEPTEEPASGEVPIDESTP